MIIYNIFLTSWGFTHKSNVFYHVHHPMLVLKLNPVVGFVANYLHLILLNYFVGFLHSKALIGLPLGNLF